MNGSDLDVKKQAFSKARQKISPTAFIKMSDEIIKWFYKDTDFKRYTSFRLLGIYGTILDFKELYFK